MKPPAAGVAAAGAGRAESPAIADAGPALFRLVRFWSRRWITRTAAEITGEMRQVQHILAVEAADTVRAHSGEATVAAVAYQLGLDHSGASRMVRDATAAGYLTRATSPRDRRQTVITLTPQGQALLASSRQWQRRAFDQLTADWTDRDRRQLATYLHRLARQLDLG